MRARRAAYGSSSDATCPVTWGSSEALSFATAPFLVFGPRIRDFEEFELVLAMDEQNLEFLLEICPLEHRHRVRLLLEFAPHLERLGRAS